MKGKRETLLQKIPWIVVKRFLIIFLPLAMVIGITIAAIYSIEAGNEVDIIRSDHFSHANLLAGIVSSDFELVVSDLMILSENQDLQALLADGEAASYQSLTQEFLSFSARKTLYDQLRFLDETGMEVVRVNFNDGQPSVVPPDQLQFKGGRYYFEDAFQLEQGQVFVSPFDLNIEHGQIEQPLKPMIRFGTPVIDSQGQKRGIVLLNYFGAELIQHLHLEQEAHPMLGQAMLLNRDGYWLKGPAPEDEWGFMYPERGDLTFGNVLPETWQRISGAESGQFRNADGLFTFATVYPLLEAWKSSIGSGQAFEPSAAWLEGREYYWKIVLHVPPDTLNAQAHGIRSSLVLLDVGLTMLAAAGSWILARASVNRKRAEREIEERRLYLEGVLGAAPDAIVTLDARQRIVEWNAGAEMLFGYSREQAIGQGIDDLVTGPGVFEEAVGFTQTLMDGGEVLPVEVVRYRKDGSPVDVIVAGSPILVGGEFIGVVVVYTDIAERKRAEEALRESEEWYRQIVEKAVDVVYITDVQGFFTYVNPPAQELTGYSTDELVGMHFTELIPADWRERVQSFYQEQFGGRDRETTLMFPIITRTGEKKWAEQTVRLLTEGDRVAGFQSIVRDITERVRAEEALRESEEKYRELVEGSLQGIVVRQGDKYVLANQAYADMVGYSTQELLEFTLDEIYAMVHADDQEMIAQRYRDRQAGKVVPDSYEHRFIRKDGGVGWAQATVSEIEIQGEQAFLGVYLDVTERRRAEEALRKRTYDLGERVKELNCLYGISALVEKPGISLGEILQGTVDLIPPAWQYPEITCARIVLEGRELKTEDFREAIWRQGSDIVVYGERIGTVGVYYLEQRPESDEGPFLKEERSLINAIAKRLGTTTEYKRAEEVLRESEEKFRTISASAQDAIIMLDNEGNISLWNEAAEKMFGYSGQEVLGKALHDFLAPQRYHEASRQGFARFKTTGQGAAVGKTLELAAVRKDGIEFPVELSLSAVKLEGKWNAIGIMRDITERKRAEEQLQHYAAELEQANEEVKQFAYIVSHDLRAPLVNLKGFAAELRFSLETVDSAMEMALPHLDEKQRQDVTLALHEDVPEALGFINSSASQMDHFISALLKLSRLGRRELNLESVDMETVVQATLESLAHQIEEHQVEVTVGPLPEVVADQTSMVQIVGNLLGNAVKYLDPDRPGELEITAEPSRDETTFHIRDNGRGIAAEDMDKVFAPFRRVGRQDVPGEGMGLPYVQALVRRHGGRIWCESELRVGTTFSFTISNRLG